MLHVPEAVDKFNEELVLYKHELKRGNQVEKHEEAYETFFIIKTTPKRGVQVSYNSCAVKAYINRNSGFMALLSTNINEPVEALQIYRDNISSYFLKNSLNTSHHFVMYNPRDIQRLDIVASSVVFYFITKISSML